MPFTEGFNVMSIAGIVKQMHLSKSLDMRGQKTRYLRLPKERTTSSVVRSDKNSIQFSEVSGRLFVDSALTF